MLLAVGLCHVSLISLDLLDQVMVGFNDVGSGTFVSMRSDRFCGPRLPVTIYCSDMNFIGTFFCYVTTSPYGFTISWDVGLMLLIKQFLHDALLRRHFS